VHAGAPYGRRDAGRQIAVADQADNLRSSYFRLKNYGKATKALDLLVEEFPSNAEYYKARGVARLQAA
jgi:Flp pilus assembly protein TadD